MFKQNTSIELQLKKISETDSKYRELWSTWDLNKKFLEPILSAIIKDYPHYSLHDHSHSESILLNIERFLGNDNIEKLSPTDLWLLLHVSYLHDFGMVIIDSKIHEVWSSKEFKSFLEDQSKSTDEDLKKAALIILEHNKNTEPYDSSWALEVKSAVTLLISSYCRSSHGDSSKGYILDISKVWGFDLSHGGLVKHRLISLIAEISAMHTKQFEDIFNLHQEVNGFASDYTHPRLIACLLRIGDILDLDNGRFNRYGDTIFGEKPNSSKTHLEKHEATKHVLVTDKIIEVEADCLNDEVYRETRKWYDSLKSEIDNLHLNWIDIAPEDFSYPPKLIPYKILRNGIEDSLELSNLKFAITQKKAFEILEGSSIYKDKFSCIREIVQNAEDASKIQLWRDIKKGMYFSAGIDEEKVFSGTLSPNDIPNWIYKIYTISISVEKNEAGNAIVCVTDHGTGISLDTLKSICNVGQSYHQKQTLAEEISEMPNWLKPTANFGIGLQSCFMATDKITVYTSSDKDGQYKITFKSGKTDGYVNVETLTEEFPRGSKFSLEFSNNLDFRYNAFGFTAKRLTRIEPFESNCIIIYKIIETIFNECSNSFFGISVVSKEANFEDNIPALISEGNKDFPQTPYKTMHYTLDEGNSSIRVWYNDNLYTININKNSHGSVKVNFKGKNVNKTPYIAQYTYPGFYITVDIYGLPTKESLSLSREELTRYASKQICEDITEIIKIFFELLINKKEEIKDNSDLVDALFLSSWIYEVNFPEDLRESLSKEEKIRIVKFIEEKKKYEAKLCSLFDLADRYPSIPFVNCEIDNSPLASASSLTDDILLENLNNSTIDNTKYSQILIDNDIKRFLQIAVCTQEYFKYNKLIEIRTFDEPDTLYSPDEFTRDILLKKLVYKNDADKIFHNNLYIMRRSIPAIQEFSNLAVDLKDIFFISCESNAKWHIISPISLDDAEKIAELSKDAFVEYILSTQPFKNLIKYVFEHSKTKSTIETIQNDYKRLIETYYDLENPN